MTEEQKRLGLKAKLKVDSFLQTIISGRNMGLLEQHRNTSSVTTVDKQKFSETQERRSVSITNQDYSAFFESKEILCDFLKQNQIINY